MRMDGNQRDASGPIVRLVGLCKSFGRLEVLREMSLEFERGKTTVVLGPSGCGKSVMLKHIVGLLRPDRGEVWLQDARVDRSEEHTSELSRRNFVCRLLLEKKNIMT